MSLALIGDLFICVMLFASAWIFISANINYLPDEPSGDEYCREVIPEKRRFSACVRSRGHDGAHRCFDGREFK